MTEKRKFEFAEIKLDQIDLGQEQARSHQVEENTDELAGSIQALGLINPITVYKKADGRFELIAGQRRLIAVTKLEWPTITAKVLLEKPSDVVAKAISLSENVMRAELTLADIKDSIIMLYHRCGANAHVIQKTLGIPYSLVLETIKYEALPPEMKAMVDNGTVDVQIAKKATDFSTLPGGEVDVKKAMLMAPELKMLVPAQVKKLKKIAKESPTASAEELLEEAKATQATHRVVIEMLLSEYDALKKAASTKGVEEDEYTYDAIMTKLKEDGFKP